MSTILPNTNKTFENKDFSKDRFPKREYDLCIFKNCDFSNAKISNIEFLECEFLNCNLSNIEVINTAFKEVRFSGCKVIGINFSKCNPFLLEFSFDTCQLSYSVFFKLELKGMSFKDCNLQEVDFTEANLSKATFDNCDLMKAVFDETNIESADFYSAYNYNINPENNQLKKAKFSKEGVLGLLEKYQILIKD
jgi:uncharacterized protein YjbI with pentapeptide repeats